MASLEKVWHRVEQEGDDVKIWLPDLYDGIGSTVGITEMTPDQAGTIKKTVSVSEGLKNGQLIRLRLTVRDALGKSKSAKVLCSITKIQDAISDVVGKQYRGGTVRSAGTPRRRRLG